MLCQAHCYGHSTVTIPIIYICMCILKSTVGIIDTVWRMRSVSRYGTNTYTAVRCYHTSGVSQKQSEEY